MWQKQFNKAMNLEPSRHRVHRKTKHKTTLYFFSFFFFAAHYSLWPGLLVVVIIIISELPGVELAKKKKKQN